MNKPIYKNFLFFIFMYTLGALCVIVTTDRGYAPFFYKLFFELFFDLYILCCILTLLPLRFRQFSSWGIAIIFYILAIIDLFCFIRLGSSISPGILQLIRETNSQESAEFLSAYIEPSILLSPVGIVLLIAVLHIVATIHLKIYIHNILKRKIILNGLIVILVLFGFFVGMKNKHYIIQTWQYRTMGQVEQFFSNEYYARRALYLPIHRTIFAIHANRLVQKELITLQHTMEVSKIDSCSYTSPVIVLIIGESYNKHHSQLYGYRHQTTPLQIQREQAQELFVFSDAVTPYNLTSEVFKNAFSLNDLTMNESWCDKPMFTNLFKKAGYQVSFFSNEFVMKQQRDIADFAGGMFLNNPVLSKLQFDIRNDKTHQYDEGLINDYYSLCSKQKPNYRLIIFSLLGQHTEYAERFPKEFARLQPKDYHRKDLNKTQLQVVIDYDNATIYNDYVVDKIVKLFEQEDAIVIYMPDHGDECFDQNLTSGRQHNDPVTKDVAINEYEIPFWIWCSPKYRLLHPTIVKQIQKSTNRPFYSDDLSHLMLYLGGISCKDYNDERNIISPLYNNKRKRMLRRSTNYDLLFSK